MAFDGSEGAEITLSAGATLTAQYRKDNPGKNIAGFIGRDHLEHILGLDDCKGIRIYYGKKSNGQPEIIPVGADSNENDILDYIADNVASCPNRCSTSNNLNS